jgi:hypothetical protein
VLLLVLVLPLLLPRLLPMAWELLPMGCCLSADCCCWLEHLQF